MRRQVAAFTIGAFSISDTVEHQSNDSEMRYTMLMREVENQSKKAFFREKAG